MLRFLKAYLLLHQLFIHQYLHIEILLMLRFQLQ
nr:MAG TPA: hypothetical protein [Caudoviricetes sp.]